MKKIDRRAKSVVVLKDDVVIKKFASGLECAKHYGLSQTSIYRYIENQTVINGLVFQCKKTPEVQAMESPESLLSLTQKKQQDEKNKERFVKHLLEYCDLRKAPKDAYLQNLKDRPVEVLFYAWQYLLKYPDIKTLDTEDKRFGERITVRFGLLNAIEKEIAKPFVYEPRKRTSGWKKGKN